MAQALLVNLDIDTGVELVDILDRAGMDYARTLPVMILPMSDPFVRNARRLYAKSKNFQGRRLSSQTIGGRFVEDAYVYRIA